MRAGSITLGLLVGFTLGGLVVGAGGGWLASSRIQGAKHAQEMQAAQEALQALEGDLGECRAKVTAESLQAAAAGTRDALDAALAPEMAEVGARALLVQSLPRLEVTRALLEVASPRMIAAEQARLGCEAVGATGDSARLGCAPGGPVLTAWSAALEAQAGCPAGE